MTQDRLDQEYRESERLRFTTSFQRILKDTLGIAVEDEQALDAETTQRLHTQFFRKFRDMSVRKSYWEPMHVVGISRGIVAGPFPEGQPVYQQDLWAVLKNLGLNLGSRSVVLFFNHERELGAVRVDAASALQAVARLWPLVKYDFCLTTDEAQDGLCLEYNQYKDRALYELSCWGQLTPKTLA